MTAPVKWRDFTWPDWVPSCVREQVEGFWAESCGRGPDQWEQSRLAPYNNGPELGTRVCMGMGGLEGYRAGEFAIGRYVHAWNNIGRLVLDDGTVKVVSLCKWWPAGTPCEPQPAKDTPDVEVEIRAAELSNLADSHASKMESLGWICWWGPIEHEPDGEFLAGFLGRGIYEHDEAQP